MINKSKSHLSFVIRISFVIWVLLFVINSAFAKEITILYTGQSHSMLYACSCPIEKDGGVARRDNLIKELKKKNPATLALDSGGFFSGGQLDEYTQNAQLDMERAKINLKAMEIMQYDAINIGDDELNFGRLFLEEAINKTKLSFISANADIARVSPYVIKEVSGIKIGIIGIIGIFASQKESGLKVSEPKIALKNALGELKKQKIDITIVLTYLDDDAATGLIKEIKGIDVMIAGKSRSKKGLSEKIDDTIILRPSWQARKLGKLSLSLEGGKIKNYKNEEIRLSDKIKDSAEISRILPRCFSDRDCKAGGVNGVCQDPGVLAARCLFPEVKKISLTVIAPANCRICKPEEMIDFLKKQFPGVSPVYLYYPDAKAAKLAAQLGLKVLPAYLLGKEIEKEKGFDNFKNNLEDKKEFYLLKQEFSGVSYFIDRKKIEGKIDVFVSLFAKDTPAFLEAVKEFKPQLHFLAIEQPKGFEAQAGRLEIEEDLRSACVQKYYPQAFWDYLSCRAKNINSSWWEDCLGEFNPEKIKACARSEEGASLLKENIGLNKEIRAMFGPAYLLDNQEVFMTQGAPSKEELKKIFKK